MQSETRERNFSPQRSDPVKPTPIWILFLYISAPPPRSPLMPRQQDRDNHCKRAWWSQWAPLQSVRPIWKRTPRRSSCVRVLPVVLTVCHFQGERKYKKQLLCLGKRQGGETKNWVVHCVAFILRTGTGSSVAIYSSDVLQIAHYLWKALPAVKWHYAPTGSCTLISRDGLKDGVEVLLEHTSLSLFQVFKSKNLNLNQSAPKCEPCKKRKWEKGPLTFFVFFSFMVFREISVVSVLWSPVVIS